MLSKVKQAAWLSAFVFSTLCPTLETKCNDCIAAKVEEIKKKTETIEPIATFKMTEEELEEEDRLGEMELLAQLVQAEAGNQDLTGKRYVVDVVLNRVDSSEFPNSVEEVIFQSGHFASITDGNFDKAAWEVTESDFEAVRLEYENRLNYDFLYFSRGRCSYTNNHYKHQDHWFGW